MRITKKGLVEIIDSNGDLIGLDGTPRNGSDLESQANNTSDYNAKIGPQPFRYDFLGRMGIHAFAEGEEDTQQNDLLDQLADLMYDKTRELMTYYYKNPNLLKSDYRKLKEDNVDPHKKSNYEFAKKIAVIIHDRLEADEEKKAVVENINTAVSMIEDKVVDKKGETELSTKGETNDVRDKKLGKIAGLLNKQLNKGDVDKLINLLERN